MRVFGKFCVLLAFSLPLGVAQAKDDDEQMEKLRRKTPSGQYVDPASFFRFHGYTSLSFTQADVDQYEADFSAFGPDLTIDFKVA